MSESTQAHARATPTLRQTEQDSQTADRKRSVDNAA